MKVVISTEGGVIQGVYTDVPEDVSVEVLEFEWKDEHTEEEKALLEEQADDLKHMVEDGKLIQVY